MNFELLIETNEKRNAGFVFAISTPKTDIESNLCCNFVFVLSKKQGHIDWVTSVAIQGNIIVYKFVIWNILKQNQLC